LRFSTDYPIYNKIQSTLWQHEILFSKVLTGKKEEGKDEQF